LYDLRCRHLSTLTFDRGHRFVGQAAHIIKPQGILTYHSDMMHDNTRFLNPQSDVVKTEAVLSYRNAEIWGRHVMSVRCKENRTTARGLCLLYYGDSAGGGGVVINGVWYMR
jgi:hypothetical protein